MNLDDLLLLGQCLLLILVIGMGIFLVIGPCIEVLFQVFMPFRHRDDEEEDEE
jgi:hypothetical protein